MRQVGGIKMQYSQDAYPELGNPQTKRIITIAGVLPKE